jgi:hypothetical protein
MPIGGTAKTVKRSFDSKDSKGGRHISEESVHHLQTQAGRSPQIWGDPSPGNGRKIAPAVFRDQTPERG